MAACVLSCSCTRVMGYYAIFGCVTVVVALVVIQLKVVLDVFIALNILHTQVRKNVWLVVPMLANIVQTLKRYLPHFFSRTDDR